MLDSLRDFLDFDREFDFLDFLDFLDLPSFDFDFDFLESLDFDFELFEDLELLELFDLDSFVGLILSRASESPSENEYGSARGEESKGVVDGWSMVSTLVSFRREVELLRGSFNLYFASDGVDLLWLLCESFRDRFLLGVEGVAYRCEEL